MQDDERAAQVIQRLRALLGKGDTQHAPVELNDLVSESLDLMHSEFVTRNVVATVQLDPALPTVLADRVQMQQVVLNLLMNACEAMVGTPHRHVARSSSARASWRSPKPPRSRCRTTARAFAPGDTERIFQPFVTTKSHGLGLGLAICRSVAEAHHGVLWAENAPEGGAIFHIQDSDCWRSAMNDNEPTPTVFLVDDDASVRSALTRALTPKDSRCSPGHRPMHSSPTTIRKDRAAWWPTSPCQAPTDCSCSSCWRPATARCPSCSSPETATCA